MRNWSKAKKSFQGRISFILSLAEDKIFSAAGDEFAIEESIKEGEIAGINSEAFDEETEGLLFCVWSDSTLRLFKNLLGDSVEIFGVSLILLFSVLEVYA